MAPMTARRRLAAWRWLRLMRLSYSTFWSSGRSMFAEESSGEGSDNAKTFSITAASAYDVQEFTDTDGAPRCRHCSCCCCCFAPSALPGAFAVAVASCSHSGGM